MERGGHLAAPGVATRDLPPLEQAEYLAGLQIQIDIHEGGDVGRPGMVLISPSSG